MINFYLSSITILSFFTFPFILSTKLKSNPIDLNLLISISSSLYFFFLLKFIFFLIDIEISQFHFYFIIFLFIIMNIFFIANNRNIVFDKLSLIVLTIFFIISTFLIFTNMPIFIAWDAVVSWNRWATELYNNNLQYSEQLYPLFWSTIWSIIYNFQGNNYTDFSSKLSNLIIILIFLLSLCYQFRVTRKISIILYLFSYIIFYKFTFIEMQYGYMDQPIAILISTIIILVLTLYQKFNYTLLYTIAFLLAITSLTKQPGYLILISTNLCIFIFYFKRKISLNHLINFILLSSLPLLIFFYYKFFFYQDINYTLQKLFNSNLLIYNTISKNISPTINTDTFFILKGFKRMLLDGGILYLFVSCSLVISLFTSIKSKNFIIIIYAFTIIIGFVIYSYCCVYSLRNSYWIFFAALTILFQSFPSFSYDRFNNFFDKKFNLKPIFFLITFFLILLIDITGLLSSKIENYNLTFKKKIGYEDTALKLKNILLIEDTCYQVNAVQQLIKFNYYLIDFKSNIQRSSLNEFKETLKENNSKTTSCNNYWVLNPKSLDINPDLKKTVNAYIDKGYIKYKGSNIYLLNF